VNILIHQFTSFQSFRITILNHGFHFSDERVDPGFHRITIQSDSVIEEHLFLLHNCKSLKKQHFSENYIFFYHNFLSLYFLDLLWCQKIEFWYSSYYEF